MSYADSHHLWRPLAAISDHQPALITAMPYTIGDNNRSPLLTPTPALISSTATTATATTADDTNDVWLQIRGMVLRNGSDGFGDLMGNESNCNNGSGGGGGVWFNETETVFGVSSNSTWEIVGMVGTAIALGLIILATVIGE